MRTDIHPLRPEDARHAYALLHLVDGTCTLKEWLGFVHDTDGQRHGERIEAGVMVAHGPDRRMLGLFAYKTSVARPARRLLIVHHFVAFDPFSHGATARSLLGAMDALADRLSCEAIRLELSPPQVRAQQGNSDILPHPINAAGYSPAGINAIKRLTRPENTD